MKCPICNREIENDSVFCEHCGSKLTQESVMPAQLKVGKVGVIGLENMTLTQIRNEVARGGRFLRFPYTMSFVLLTLKLTSDIYFVRHNEPASSYGSKYAWINLLLGWWGIPFGPIYTLMCIGGSFKGEDMTREVMSLLESLNRQ